MSVEVANDDSVAVRVVEEKVEVGFVVWRARRRGRDVHVVNIDGGVVEVDLGGDNLDSVVSSEYVGDVDRRKLEVVADKESNAASTTRRPITADDW